MVAFPKLEARNGFFETPKDGVLPRLRKPEPSQTLAGYAVPYNVPTTDLRRDQEVRNPDGTLAIHHDLFKPSAFDHSLSQIKRKRLDIPLKLAHEAGPVHFLSTRDWCLSLSSSSRGLMLSIDLLQREARDMLRWMDAHPDYRYLSVGIDVGAWTLQKLSSNDPCPTRVISACDLTEVSLTNKPAFGTRWTELFRNTIPA